MRTADSWHEDGAVLYRFNLPPVHEYPYFPVSCLDLSRLKCSFRLAKPNLRPFPHPFCKYHLAKRNLRNTFKLANEP